MKNKNLILSILPLLSLSLLANACNQGGGSTPTPPEPKEYSPSNPHTVEYAEGITGITVEAPFTIYDDKGETPTLTVKDSGQAGTNIPTVYDDLYRAIRVAGANSTSRNALQVLDKNYLQVFKRAKKTDNYLYTGKDFYGLAGQKSAKSFCLANEKSYAINGLGSDYYYLSRTDMVKGQSVAEESLETFAGAYNYMFSTNGDGKGFVYATAYIRLSECTYCPPTDGDGWNAYIFINLAQNINCDLGLIGIFNQGSHVCQWKMVRNCSSTYHTAGTSGIEKDAKFFVWQDKIVTESKNYNFATGECTGFDDLYIEVLGQSWGWTMNITNLKTNVTTTAVDHHYNADGSDKTDDTAPNYGRALIAASYCPVTLGVWNWDCGARCTGVTWDHIYLKGVLSGTDRNNIQAYRDENVQSYELYPGSDVYREGYAQGDYRSSHSFGVRESDGAYPSGATYKAGDRYMTYAVTYSD